MKPASAMRDDAHIRATLHVLLHEDFVRGVVVRLLYWIRPLRNRANVDGFHHRSRTEWFGRRGHPSWDEHVSCIWLKFEKASV